MRNDEVIKNVTYMRDSLDPLSERKLIESLDVAIEALREQPIRCKDCVYWKTVTVSKTCTRGVITSIMNRGNDFCSYAERVNDDE